MIDKFIRRFAYKALVDAAQSMTGIKPHYRTRYALYLYGPRWLIIRSLRVWWDGWCCHDCGARYLLQVHHTSYRNKGKGLGLGEFLDCVTVCDECHGKRHGR